MTIAVADSSAAGVTGTAVDLGPVGSPAYQPLSVDSPSLAPILYSPKLIRTHVLLDIEPEVATEEFLCNTLVNDFIPKCVRKEAVQIKVISWTMVRLLASGESRVAVYFELSGPPAEPKRVLGAIRLQLADAGSRLSSWLRNLTLPHCASVIRLEGGLVARQELGPHSGCIEGWKKLASFTGADFSEYLDVMQPGFSLVALLQGSGDEETASFLSLPTCGFSLFKSLSGSLVLFARGIDIAVKLAGAWIVPIGGVKFPSQAEAIELAESTQTAMTRQKSLRWQPPQAIFAVGGILETCVFTSGHTFHDFMTYSLPMDESLRLGACLGARRCVRLRDVGASLASALEGAEAPGVSAKFLQILLNRPSEINETWDAFVSGLRDELLAAFRKRYSSIEDKGQREAARRALAQEYLAQFKAAIRGGRQADALAATLEMGMAAFATESDKKVKETDFNEQLDLSRKAVRDSAAEVASKTVLSGPPLPETCHDVLAAVKIAVGRRVAELGLNPQIAQEALLSWLRTEYTTYLEGLTRSEPKKVQPHFPPRVPLHAPPQVPAQSSALHQPEMHSLSASNPAVASSQCCQIS